MSDFEIVQTAKGNPSALYDGHRYRRHKQNDENITYWACVKENSAKCKGRMITKDNIIVSVSPHICIPDVAGNEVAKQISVARKRAREEDLPVSKIYEEELGKLYDRGYELIAEIPQYTSCKSSLYRARQEAQEVSHKELNQRSVKLPDSILNMKVGFNFLLFDDGDSERILAFASSSGREILSRCRHFFMDGTFKSVCTQFSQIFTLHADTGSTSAENKVIPVLFALLPNKRKETYVRFFALMKKHVQDFDPQSIVMDFEAAAITSLREIFPVVNILGCNFHFNQCLWRKIQEVGLINEYKNNEEIRRHVRMCASLAFLPISMVVDGWLCIQEETPENSKLQEFYDYFVTQWLENSSVDVSMWNCYHRRHRTNNVVEGWHRKLNTVLNKSHPNILELIKRFKKEAENSDFLYRRTFLNLETKKRKKTTIKLDERINRCLNELEATGDIRKCLKTLSYVHKLE